MVSSLSTSSRRYGLSRKPWVVTIVVSTAFRVPVCLRKTSLFERSSAA
jgi:hypothetical protein